MNNLSGIGDYDKDFGVEAAVAPTNSMLDAWKKTFWDNQTVRYALLAGLGITIVYFYYMNYCVKSMKKSLR